MNEPANKRMQQTGGAMLSRDAPPAADARCWPDQGGRIVKLCWVAAAMLLSVACVSSARSTPRAPVPPLAAPRSVGVEVVDLRGIWRKADVDPEAARARGLDPTDIVVPRKVLDVRPNYPAEAREARISGTVTVECIIRVDGLPSECSVIGGPEELRASSLTAVLGWRWRPLTVAGVPKPAIVHLTVNFRIS